MSQSTRPPTEVETVALEIWRARELDFPPRVRRMKPDSFDMVSGAWARTLAMAKDQVDARLNRVDAACERLKAVADQSY